MTIEQRLIELDEIIKKDSFRYDRGKANEVNYWIFDYSPKDELIVRDHIRRLKERNARGSDNFKIVEYDLYDFIIDKLEEEGFLKQCEKFEERSGFDRITRAITNLLKINDDENEIVKYIKENTPEDSIVFLTGIGKCYPILRSHKVLNTLSQSFNKSPVVLFFPGTYDEQSLKLFDALKDDNYYRAFKLVKD